jgi:hypothetical protein
MPVLSWEYYLLQQHTFTDIERNLLKKKVFHSLTSMRIDKIKRMEENWLP